MTTEDEDEAEGDEGGGSLLALFGPEKDDIRWVDKGSNDE
jgi:hypothetical protein